MTKGLSDENLSHGELAKNTRCFSSSDEGADDYRRWPARKAECLRQLAHFVQTRFTF